MGTFVPDGYLREPSGPPYLYRGLSELHSFFTRYFVGGGICLEHCVVTDDGVRSGLVYNCVRWGHR